MDKQQLIDDIAKLDATLAKMKTQSAPQGRIDAFQNKRNQLQADLDALVASGTPAPAASPVPVPAPAPAPDAADDNALAALAATLNQLMLAGGGGADSFEIRKMIEEVLEDRKISLKELDESVLQEIRKNQTVVLELPKYGMKIQLESKDANLPFLHELIDDVLAGNNIYMIGDAGSGKAQPLYSNIATPNGWVSMGEIKQGDSVFAADGSVTKVKAVYDRGVRPIYRVHFTDGTYADCCDEHLWAVIGNLNKSRGKGFEIKALKDFKDSLTRSKGTALNYHIPVAKAVKYKPVKHIIHPYVLGVLIGDGGISQDNVTLTTPDAFIVQKVASLLPSSVELNKVAAKGRCDTYTIRIKDKKKAKTNVVKDELTRLGLMYKKSIHKFIPDEYMFDSIENRQELLLGLNDTDGSCSAKKPTFVEFSTSSESLAHDYVELIQSLGGICNVSSRLPKFKDSEGNVKIGHKSFRLTPKVYSDIQMFSLPKKKANFKHQTKYTPTRIISSVEFISALPCRCIEIAHPSHLYLTDNYIVTHNTYTAEQIAKILKRELTTINCSQYTSPTEIIGGQTIEGYKDGKLILAWEKGKILLLDEMPKLDPNTAGLLNDALAKSTKTKKPYEAKIGSANPDQAPIERNDNFACIATGNIYPNRTDPKYVANNQQDLSLLDRFSGSVYYVSYDKLVDQINCRYDFLFKMLVGNYYEYMEAKKAGAKLPEAKGLRTVLEDLNLKNYALTSYRTLTAFRVAFEYQLVRAMHNVGKPKDQQVPIDFGQTVLKAWNSYLVAFDSSAVTSLLAKTAYTDAYITQIVADTIDMLINGGLQGFTRALCPDLAKNVDLVKKSYEEASNWIAAEEYIVINNLKTTE